MFKTFAYLVKREGLSAEAFAAYYENHHVPLILGLAPAPLVYKRHYVVRGDQVNLGGVDFDVMTEMAWVDRFAREGWVAAISAAADQVAADEARFLDRTRTRSVLVSEQVTAG